MALLRFFIFFLFAKPIFSSYNILKTLPDRPTTVHLFEWKWTDIANECEQFLSKYKYGAVQISPPNDHLMITTDLQNGRKDMSWWLRYQPISYKLQSRSGTQEQLQDMINRCNAVGVRIIVDAVINHMASANQKSYQWGQYPYSSAKSDFDSTDGVENFPAVPYTSSDFHDRFCHGEIQDGDYQNNAYNVRMCRLGGLLDLDQGNQHVRQKIADYFNSLVDMGVAGFRIDAAKHMWPDDIASFLGMVKDLRSDIYGPNQRPFIMQEVIDCQAIGVNEYFRTGSVTNFGYGRDVSAAVKKEKDFQYFSQLGPTWGYMPDTNAFVFVDNHDNQRDGGYVLTYKDGQRYIMAVTYMLAWPYGTPNVISSFDFTDRNQGPPSNGWQDGWRWEVNTPTFQNDGKCAPESGWICEHRWPEIRRMSTFRGVTQGMAPANIVTDSNRIAFRRGDKGFFALNNDDSNWAMDFYVGLPVGSYCDVISGEYDATNHRCTGASVYVDPDGVANILVKPGTTLAIHVEQRIPTTPIPSPGPLPSSYQRTVIIIEKQTNTSDILFIRGGTNDCNNKWCTIPISHRTTVSVDNVAFRGWSQGDYNLDWFGGEFGQGTYDGVPALGTPLAYTTNDPSDSSYNPLNKYRPNFWLVDVMMDCSSTSNGWFYLKTYVKRGYDELWEDSFRQRGRCDGNVGASTPSDADSNHAGLCGTINRFKFGTDYCEINRF